ncbi:MAG: hypothetical protein IJQ21_10485 [Lachnospiraceae bacterium]|nr:hypothetical protein [Lachnospiraceae bacterium]
MDQELKRTWFQMPIGMQISNVGSEVFRALSWKNKGNEKRKIGFCNKAIEFLQLSIEDPKNRHRAGELSFCIEELQDFFLGENLYKTTEEMLHKYYDAFLT